MPQVDRQRFRLQDLTMKIKTSVDRSKWNEDRYEAFIDELCGDREYQKEAIRASLRYILSGEYNNLRDLARENWDNNDILHERYGTWENFEKHLQLPSKLSASIDLATGTGKSYVIYGIALILLAEGVVDRVLVLCPSTTIEGGLLEKFRILSGNTDLGELLPTNAKIFVPKIINASETITSGCICVENRDAVYEHVKSSIKDSLWGKGAKVAVLNDEAHHVANDPEAKTKRWKEFLEKPEYGFRIVMGFSGTCYVGNDYFSDVIYRYSLRDAMEQRFVKNVKYIAEQPSTGEDDEYWQLIYNRHEKLRKDLVKKRIRPLTIIVTPTIKKCKEVGDELVEFLVDKKGLTEDEAKEKVLIVYNNAPDVPKLRKVDDDDNEVEWILSVSMLTEGWDVKRVFQIVPHEERAFNSKLLIAQVLGRGLRIPIKWTGAQAEVSIFNHAAWAGSIRHLVNEILENEKRLTSRVIPDSKYHFDLHNINYLVETKAETKKKKSPFNLLKDNIVDLPSEGETVDVTIDFEKAIMQTRETWSTTIRRKMHTPEEVAAQMFNTLEMLDMESVQQDENKEGTRYAKDYPYDRLLKIVRDSLKGDTMVSEGNRQRLLAALGTVRRLGTKVVRYKFSPDQLITFSTKERHADTVSAAQLRSDKVVFVTDMTSKYMEEEKLEFFQEVIEPDSGYKCYPVKNIYDFKTPLNLAIADSGPERNFIREIVSPSNVQNIDAWIKSTSMRFYGIEYAWRKGEHPKRATFNPDFFIKLGKFVLVIEVKEDHELNDPSLENIKKNEYALAHFEKLNILLEQAGIQDRYQFHFITPKDFPEFFKRLREGTITAFRSKLDVKLKELSMEYDRRDIDNNENF